MDPMTIGMLASAAIGLGDAGLAWIFNDNLDSDDAADFDVSSLPSDVQAYWNSLSPSTKLAYMNQYMTDGSTLFNSYKDFDEDALLADLANTEMYEDFAYLGDAPLYSKYFDEAASKIAAENEERFSRLDNLLSYKENTLTDQLRNSRADYDNARVSLLSQQYQQGSQLLDTYRSELNKSRRNALEAGASAGIRIADNINTLLSVQNKQASTAMETSNQLAKMLIAQRNSEASLRNSYMDALTQDSIRRDDIEDSTLSRTKQLADVNYGNAKEVYDTKHSDVYGKYSGNPLAGAFAKGYNQYKSKYSQ